MTWLEFLSSFVASLAWPVTVLAAVVYLRPVLTSIVNAIRRVKRFQYHGIEVDMDGDMAAITEVVSLLPEPSPPAEGREQLRRLEASEQEEAIISASPSAAIIVAWAKVEKVLRQLAKKYCPGINQYITPGLILAISERAAFPAGLPMSIDNLRRLRN